MRLESQKIRPHLWTNSFALVLLDFKTTPSGEEIKRWKLLNFVFHALCGM